MGQNQNIPTNLQAGKLPDASTALLQQILLEIRLLNVRFDKLKEQVCTPVTKTNKIKELYTTNDLMEMFGLSLRTLLTFRTEGLIGFTKTGKSVRYTQQHVDDYKAREKNGGKGNN